MERLSKLDTTKACGPDKIPARLLEECSEQIAPSLCSLFNHSLTLGQIPHGNPQMLHLSTKKILKRLLKIIGLYPYSQLLAKFWSAAWAIDFTII